MRVSFSLSASSQQFHSGRIYIVWAACKESGFQQIGIWLQNPSLLSDLLCIVPVRIWPIFCSGSLEFFAVGHPLLRAGLEFLLLTSVSDCVLTSPFIKCQNFCREICGIWNKFQWPSSCQVEAIWAISFFPENSDLLEFCSHTPENLHSNRFFIIFNNLLESFEITEVKSLRSFNNQNSSSPVQHDFVSKYNQIQLKISTSYRAFTLGGENTATSENPFYKTFITFKYTIRQRKSEPAAKLITRHDLGSQLKWYKVRLSHLFGIICLLASFFSRSPLFKKKYVLRNSCRELFFCHLEKIKETDSKTCLWHL